MTAIQQTVEIDPSRRLTIDVPPEVPTGRVILTFTPASMSPPGGTPPSGGGGKIHLTAQMVDEMLRDESLRSLTGILHTDMTAAEIRAERLGNHDHIG